MELLAATSIICNCRACSKGFIDRLITGTALCAGLQRISLRRVRLPISRLFFYALTVKNNLDQN